VESSLGNLHLTEIVPILWKLCPLIGRLNHCEVVTRLIRAPIFCASASVMQFISLPESAQPSSIILMFRSMCRCLLFARACRVVSFIFDAASAGVAYSLQTEQLPLQFGLPQLLSYRLEESDVPLLPSPPFPSHRLGLVYSHFIHFS